MTEVHVPELAELGSLSSELAFTGRSDPMTFQQWKTLDTFLAQPELHWFVAVHNNGDGADGAFHNLCEKYAFRSILADPHDPSLGHMAKNRALIARAGVLIAVPPTYYMLKTGSGTWETIKYGWKKGIPVWIIWPHGEMVRHTKEDCPKEPSVDAHVRLIQATLEAHEDFKASRDIVQRCLKEMYPTSVVPYARKSFKEKAGEVAHYLSKYPNHRVTQQLVIGSLPVMGFSERIQEEG